MKRSTSTITAFVVMPLIPAIGLTVPEMWSPDDFDSPLWLALLYYPHALIITSAIGVPAYFIGKWLGLVRWWAALIFGVIVGASFGYGLTTSPVYPSEARIFAAWVTALGGLSGIVFWWIWWMGHRPSYGNAGNSWTAGRPGQ